MATIDVKDASGSTVAVEKPLAPGRAAASLSRPVALSTEDKTSLDAVSGAISKTVTTATASYTRPGDTTAYAASDALAESTTSPTALTFTVASAAGRGGVISDLIVTSSNAPGTPLQGELYLFDTAPTPVNDNAAFTISDSEILTLVAIIPFSLLTVGANSRAHVQGISSAFTTGAATSLRGLVRVTNAYTPASGEVLSFRLKCLPAG